MKRLHRCPAPGCTAKIPIHQAFCRSHWNLVPSPIKKSILDAWRTHGPLTPPHVAAMDAAINALLPRATPKVSAAP